MSVCDDKLPPSHQHKDVLELTDDYSIIREEYGLKSDGPDLSKQSTKSRTSEHVSSSPRRRCDRESSRGTRRESRYSSSRSSERSAHRSRARSRSPVRYSRSNRRSSRRRYSSPSSSSSYTDSTTASSYSSDSRSRSRTPTSSPSSRRYRRRSRSPRSRSRHRERSIDRDKPKSGPKRMLSSVVTIPDHKEHERMRLKTLEAQKGDQKGLQRNKRMFGMLLGTLQKFQSEESSRSGIIEKRSRIEQKVEAANQLDAASHSETIHSEINVVVKPSTSTTSSDSQLQSHNWEDNQRYMTNFIQTESKPPIFWKPRKYTHETEIQNKLTKDRIEAEISKRTKHDLSAETSKHD